MQLLALAVAALSVVGGAAGYWAWQENDEGYSWARCASAAHVDPADEAPFLYRTRIRSDMGDHVVRLCVWDETGRLLFNEEFELLFGNERVVDAWVTAQTVNAWIELDESPAGGGSPLRTDSCPSGAFEKPVVLKPGYNGDAGQCIVRPVPPAEAMNKDRSDLAIATGARELMRGGAAAAMLGAVSAGAGAAVLVRTRKLARLGVLFLFSRISRPRTLDQQARSRIHMLLSQEPGLNGSQIRRRLGFANGHVAYHLAVLEREEIVTSVGLVPPRYFIVGTLTPDEMRRRAALRNEHLARFYAAVMEAPGANVRQVAQRLGVSAPQASRVARRLERAGLLMRDRRGRNVVLKAVAAQT
jgi:DNA-binding MarR family transcriptional regulator